MEARIFWSLSLSYALIWIPSTTLSQACQCEWTQVTNTESYDLVAVSQSEWYVNTRTTVRKSVDGGANWTTTNWPLGIVRNGTSVVSGITHNGSRLVVGALDNGMYLTTNGGASFTASGPTGFGCLSANMISLPTGTVLATMGGSLRGIYRLPQGSSTWTRVLTFSGDFFDFAQLDNAVFATLQVPNHTGGLYSSDNDGQGWTQLLSTSGWDNPAVVEVDRDTVYFVDNRGRFHWFDRTAKVARLISTIPQCSLPNDLEVSADGVFYVTNSSAAGSPVANSPQVSYSADRGRTWQSCEITGVKLYHEMSMVGGSVYVGTDKGLYRLSLTGGFSNSGVFNPLPDTTRACGASATLDAGPGYSGYSWSNGAKTQSISAVLSGWYKVVATGSSGCTFADSTFLSLVKAEIRQKDTSICKGSSVTLSIDSLFALGTACGSGGIPESLRSGLVGYWPFCGNADDASGNGNNGSVFGAALAADRFGNPASAYSFDGIDDHILVPDNASLRPSLMSISLWYYTETSDPFRCLLSKTQFSGSANEQYFLDLSDFGVKLNSNCTPNNGWSYLRPNATGMLVNGRWTHLVCVWDGTTMKVYRDGVLLLGTKWGASSGLTGSITDCVGGLLQFGRWWSSDPKWFKGRIDDIAIWNRALSEAEIGRLHMPRPNVTWSTGASIPSIGVAPAKTTTYYVTVSDGVTTCTDSVTVRVATADTSLTASGATAFCSNGAGVALQAGNAASYQWLRDGTLLPGASSRTLKAVASGGYSVVVTSVEGCRDTSRTVRVDLSPEPNVSFTVDDSVRCLPDSRFRFTNASTIQSGTLTYAWDFGNGTTSQQPSPSVQYERAGAYRVTLRATSDLGCAQSASMTIRIDSMPKGVRYSPVNALANRPVTLDARNIGVSWRWSPPAQLTGPDMRSPVFQGDREQQYLITIRNAFGCAAVDTLLVRAVKEYGIHVPGGFTPDNDGRNDRLHPFPVGIREMRVFRVYNRWGELVFDNRNANASTGWDGTFRGRPSPIETYAWIAEGIDLDGNVIRRSGNTVLIR